MQGMGYALIEEMVWDGARLANPSLMDYKIPTFAELPETLRAYHRRIRRAERPVRRQERRRARHQRRRRGDRQRRRRCDRQRASAHLPLTPRTRARRCLRETRGRDMKLEDYPPQEPLSALGSRVPGAACSRAGAGIDGDEFAYGADPYQQLAVYPRRGRVRRRARLLPRRRLDQRLQGMDGVHGAGRCTAARRHLRLRRLSARAAAPVSRPASTMRRCGGLGRIATRPSTAAIRRASSSAAIRPAATTRRCWR